MWLTFEAGLRILEIVPEGRQDIDKDSGDGDRESPYLDVGFSMDRGEKDGGWTTHMRLVVYA